MIASQQQKKKRERKVLIVFDDMIADIMSTKKFQTKCFTCIVSQAYLPVPH